MRHVAGVETLSSFCQHVMVSEELAVMCSVVLKICGENLDDAARAGNDREKEERTTWYL